MQEILQPRGLVDISCLELFLINIFHLLTADVFQNGVDYEDLLNQKRRDEARYRQGGYSANLRSANSDGFLNRVTGPANSYGNTGGFNEQLEDLSQAVSAGDCPGLTLSDSLSL